jgi:hypothetical protein
VPAEAEVLAKQYREAVKSCFPKGARVDVQVRNQKGTAVLDFKGIPVEQVSKLAELFTAELPPVRELQLVEKAPLSRECVNEVAALCLQGEGRQLSRAGSHGGFEVGSRPRG